jgi:hypothetical protein
MLKPSDSGTMMFFGMPGSGKSWLARHEALISDRRIIAIDTTRRNDWCNVRERFIPPEVRAWLRANRTRQMAVVSSFSDWRSQWKKGTKLIVVQSGDDEAKADILGKAVKQEGIAIVVHEIHTLNQRALDHIDYVATEWRHHGLRAGWDTQRPARIATTTKELATQTHVFTLVGPRDRAACEELVTGDVAAFVRAHQSVLAAHKKGVRGAHVALDETRAGPYECVRMRPDGVRELVR